MIKNHAARGIGGCNREINYNLRVGDLWEYDLPKVGE